jgi:hypothetical protein
MKRKPQQRRRKSEPAIHYTPGERKIFRFFNGKKIVGIDPLPVQFAFQEYPGDIERDAKMLSITSPEAQAEVAEAFRRMVGHVRRAFHLEPYDDERGGLTDQECVDLFGAFTAFLADIKKKAGISVTPSRPVIRPVGSATANTSGSSSTVPAASTDRPSPSPSVSA